MNVIVIGKKTFVGPAGWEHITPRHFLQLLNWRVRFGSEPAGKFVLLQLWYGIRYRHARLLDDDQRTELLSVLDFLDERPELWILPKLTLKARSYVGPGDGLEHLTFGEFMRAQSARDKFMAKGETLHLSELVAALYRPKALFWQPAGEAKRRLFDVRRYERQALAMLQLPPAVLQGVLLNYEGCLDRFPEQYPYLFGSASEGEGGSSWLDVGLSLARQTASLGTFYELERSDLFLVLTTLDALMKENAELKAKLEAGGKS